MAAIASWAASTAYSVGDVRKATTAVSTGVHFKVTTAGTSGSSEPTWNAFFGSETGDGSVTWTAVSATTSELQKANPSNIIELFVLELDSTIHGSQTQMTWRFHNGTSENLDQEASDSNIIFAGNEYTRMPIQATGFEYNAKQLPRPSLTVSNIFGTITTILLTLTGGLEGAKVTRIRTLERYIDDVNFDPGFISLEESTLYGLTLEDGNYMKLEGTTNPHGSADPSATFPDEIYYVDRKKTENRSIVEFELAASFDLQGIKLPKRQVLPGDFPGVGSFYA